MVLLCAAYAWQLLPVEDEELMKLHWQASVLLVTVAYLVVPLVGIAVSPDSWVPYDTRAKDMLAMGLVGAALMCAALLLFVAVLRLLRHVC